MPIDDDSRRSDDHLPGVPNRIRHLIGQADDMLMQHLTPDEFDRLANADVSIERLDKAKEELVRKVLARLPTERGDVAESSLRVSVALREMLDEERLEYHGLEQQLGEARQIYDELMRVAMEKRGTDDSRPDED